MNAGNYRKEKRIMALLLCLVLSFCSISNSVFVVKAAGSQQSVTGRVASDSNASPEDHETAEKVYEEEEDDEDEEEEGWEDEELEDDINVPTASGSNASGSGSSGGKGNADLPDEEELEEELLASASNAGLVREIMTLSEAADELDFLRETAFEEMYALIFDQTSAYADEEAVLADQMEVIYVASEAEEESSSPLGSPANPYTSLREALTGMGSSGGILCLESDYESSNGELMAGYDPEKDNTLDIGWPHVEKPVIIVAEDPETAVPIRSDWVFYANTGFYHVGIEASDSSGSSGIYANGYTAVFGGEGMNNLSVSAKGSGTYCPTLFGGAKDGGVVEETHLYVYGGTWDRIYGGGADRTEVTGTAYLTVNGRVDDEAGEPVSGACSIVLKNENASAYQDKESMIIGGAVVTAGGISGHVGNTEVTVSYLNYEGTARYRVVPNGGELGRTDQSGTARITVESSSISTLSRGDGTCHGYLEYEITDSVITDLTMKQLCNDGGMTSDNKERREIRINCQDSEIKNFKCREPAVNGGSESSSLVDEVYQFQNCIIGTLNCGASYLGVDTERSRSVWLEQCKFTGYGSIGFNKVTIQNMTQKVIGWGGGSTDTGFQRTATEEEVYFAFAFSALRSLCLNEVTVDAVSYGASYQLADLDLELGEGAVWSGHSLTLGNLSGTGTLYLTDGSTANIRSIADGTAITFGASGTIEDKCWIVANHASDDGGEFVFDEATTTDNGLYTLKVPGTQISFWYISKTELTYNPSALIYVDQAGGSDEIGDGTMDAPYQSLEKAYQVITSERNQIVLMSQYNLPWEEELPNVPLPEGVPAILSADDGVNDYSAYAILNFASSGTSSRNCLLYTDTIFQDIGLKYDTTETNRHVLLYAQGHKVQVLEHVNPDRCGLYAGGTDNNQTFASADLTIQSGSWIYGGLGYGIFGDKEDWNGSDLIDKDVVNICVEGTGSITYLYMRSESEVYGNVKCILEGTLSGNYYYYFQSDVYGNMDVRFAMAGSTGNCYDERWGGVHYGTVTYRTEGVRRYYYPLYLSGTYYAGMTIDCGESEFFQNTSGIVLGGQSSNSLNLEIHRKPITICLPESASISNIRYEPGREDRFIFKDGGCVDIIAETSISRVGPLTASTDHICSREHDLVPGLNLTFAGSGDSEQVKVLDLQDFYGFETLTVTGNVQVNAYSALDVAELTVEEQARLACLDKVTVRDQLTLGDGAVLECSDTLTAGAVTGSVALSNGAGVLELNGAPKGNNRISGSVTGYLRLYSNQSYIDDTECQYLYVNNQYHDRFLPSIREGDNDEQVFIRISDTKDEKVHFGISVDYSLVYVDAEGDDTRSGLSAETAVRTLEQAYKLVTSGGKIVICSPLSITQWPDNAYKTVEFTSYDGEVDYRTEKQAALKLDLASITLKGAATFGCMTMELTRGTKFYAAGYPITFGLSPEEMEKLPEGVENYSSNASNAAASRYLYVNGSDSRYAFPTSVTIHSGTFYVVCPWVYENWQGVYGREGEELYQVTMTGGTVHELSDGYIYTQNKGIIRFDLSGGTVDLLRSYSENERNGQYRKLIYDIRDDFVCQEFYISHTNYSLSGVTVRIHDLNQPLPLVCLTNRTNSAIAGPVEFSIEHARIERMEGGVNSNQTYEYKAGDITLNLGEGAEIGELYAGCTGIYEAINNLYIHLQDPSARIGAFYRTGTTLSLGAKYVELQADFDTPNDTAYAIDFLHGAVDRLSVSRGSYVMVTKEAGAYLEQVDVAGGGQMKLLTGTVLPGGYTGAVDSEEPARLELSNASSIVFGGPVSGYTELTGSFPNGVTVKGKYDEASDPDNFIYKKDEDGETQENQVIYSSDAENSIWTLPDLESTGIRTSTYVSKDGVGTATGTHAAPVNTLAAAYDMAQGLYRDLLTERDRLEEQEDLTKEEAEKLEQIKEALEQGIAIYIMDEIEIGDFSDLQLDAEEFSQVTVCGLQGDYGTPALVFGDSSWQLELPTGTIFRNLTLQNQCWLESPAVYGQGHSVLVESSVTVNGSGKGFSIYGGSKTGEAEAAQITVLGGTWQNIYGGGSAGAVAGNVSLTVGQDASAVNVYGGGEGSGAEVKGAISLEINGGKYTTVYGGGRNGVVDGTVQVDFVRGEIGALYGGGLEYTATAGKTVVRIGTSSDGQEKAVITSMFRGSGLRGGLSTADGMGTTDITIGQNAQIEKGVQFCAGGYAGNVTSTKLMLEGGTVLTDVYGGGWGEANSTDYGNVSKTTEVVVKGGTITGNIYGGGSQALVNGTSQVTLSGNAYSLTGNVYGGGNAAGVQKSEVTVDGSLTGNVFGGSYNIVSQDKAIQKSAEVKLSSGTVTGAVFGGSDTAGPVSETVSVQVTGTVAVTEGVYGGGSMAALEITPAVTVAPEATLTGNLYGGGKGAVKTGFFAGTANLLRSAGDFFTSLIGLEHDYEVDGLMDANVPSTEVTIRGQVTGNVYGGGELATVGSRDREESVTSIVIEDGSCIIGKVYGGGKGRDGKNYAVIYGSTKVTLNGGTVETGDSSVQADTGCVFGGGEIAPVRDNTLVIAEDGSASYLFGGNDISGTVGGTAGVQLPEDSRAQVQYVYGGGRDAATGQTQVTISGGTVTDAFGGGYGKTAETENAAIKVTGGTVGTVYGGGNAATVTRSADITIATQEKQVPEGGAQTAACVETVFAGNNQADMAIQPELHLESGRIGTLYGGGNEGVMTKADGLSYTLAFPKIEIDTVYAGCRNTAKPTADTVLTLVSGTYGTVYGGNNMGGHMEQTHVVVSAADAANSFKVNTVYGGGNAADSVRTKVELQRGSVDTVYGGGNAATAEHVAILMGETEGAGTTETADRKAGDGPVVRTLYCGNNAAAMKLDSTKDLELRLENGAITEFYGGGNAGAMTGVDEGGYTLNQTFDSPDMEITNLYGGCNQADVSGTVRFVLAGAVVKNAYGGCNTSGVVPKAELIAAGDGITNLYGGGRGEETLVKETEVRIQSGTVSGNVYGGSGYGKVETAHVLVQEDDGKDGGGQIRILGSVYGGGYGTTSVTGETKVTVNMDLAIASDQDPDQGNADLVVKEGEVQEIGTATSGKTETVVSWNPGRETAVSYIAGDVFGGGDMGKVGDGYINQSSNTATISLEGAAQVEIVSGHIKGSVFGGGSGIPKEGLSYTVYMGTIFGSCDTKVNGGYVEGSIYGGGYQSRVYAGQGSDGTGRAAAVDIRSDQPEASIIIGISVFGGGNKGDGTAQNASVYTVIGDTVVNISGPEESAEAAPIYFLSDSKGGVYGDGNLCLVSGTRTVNLTDFHEGSNYNLLKTFYSLQRADEVNLTRSRIVLEGAKDLVDEKADDTLYAINRVSRLNMKDNSSIKLTTIVNLLGELTSDQDTDTVYIDRGNNGVNGYIRRGGQKSEDVLTEEQIRDYRLAYEDHLNQKKDESQYNYTSFNVVCVANGRYLEIRKNDSEYGNVVGLFTLELLHANPGEGGGFVYANIGAAEGSAGDRGSTGDFICVTRSSEDEECGYMDVYDNVGGLTSDGNGTADYMWYYWYIKGGKYTYSTYVNGYIGTTETSFEESIMLPEMNPGYRYYLHSVTGEAPTADKNSSDKFNQTRLQESWDDETDKEKDAYAIEVEVVSEGLNTEKETATSIGYLCYDADYSESDGEGSAQSGAWGIIYHKDLSADDYKNAGEFVVGTGNSEDREEATLAKNLFYSIPEGTTGLRLRFVLHKGSGVDVEIRDVKVSLSFDVLQGEQDGINGGENSHLTVNAYTSITRLVPTQAVYLSSGRFYAGVSSDNQAKITSNSVFTAQFITRYVPSAFNNNQNTIKEKLTAAFSEKYLLDEETGIGFTIMEGDDGDIDLKYVTSGNIGDYMITESDDGYLVDWNGDVDSEEDDGDYPHPLQCESAETSAFTFPRGTMITLVAKMDDYAYTYWYYYCNENRSEILLSDFVQMNTNMNDSNPKHYSFTAAAGGNLSMQTSNRVTENLTFVFDFANVDTDTEVWWSDIGTDTVAGRLQLKHETDIGSYQNVDIMDYVSEMSETVGEEMVVTYTRAHPTVSNSYELSKNRTGVEDFQIALSDDRKVHYVRDRYAIRTEIVEDFDYINTRYDEREYAVMLQLLGEDNTAIPFPEGITFVYAGQEQPTGRDNTSVIIPVKTAGAHTIEIVTGLEAFEPGTVTLQASLYSSSVASYYNELKADVRPETLELTMAENPRYRLHVEAPVDENGEAERNARLTGKGRNLTLEIQGGAKIPSDETGDGAADEAADTVTAEVYRYDRESQSYIRIPWAEVFAGSHEAIPLIENLTLWSPQIASDAGSGTYRLEFRYQDKVEYWDFVVE